MTRVVIESPCNAPTREGIERNLAYARECVVDSLHRGEAPYASHLFFVGILDDLVDHERTLGMMAGFCWGAEAEIVAVYSDLGVSRGMQQGIDRYRALQIPVETRFIR